MEPQGRFGTTVFFGVECTFWTSRQELVQECGGGGFHCPYCHGHLKRAQESAYQAGLKNYLVVEPTDVEWPSMWAWARDGKCFKNIDDMREAYRKAVTRRN